MTTRKENTFHCSWSQSRPPKKDEKRKVGRESSLRRPLLHVISCAPSLARTLLRPIHSHRLVIRIGPARLCAVNLELVRRRREQRDNRRRDEIQVRAHIQLPRVTMSPRGRNAPDYCTRPRDTLPRPRSDDHPQRGITPAAPHLSTKRFRFRDHLRI
jgi:hypothetical protein